MIFKRSQTVIKNPEYQKLTPELDFIENMDGFEFPSILIEEMFEKNVDYIQ